jgi:thiol:disulfide interchange protein
LGWNSFVTFHESITLLSMLSRWLFSLFLVLGVVFPNPALGQAQTQVTLILDTLVTRPGDTIQAAVILDSAKGWHTYWVNPGEAGAGGQATTIDWELPDGITAGDIQWPTPRKLKEEIGAVFAYEGRNALLVPIHIATNVSPGLINLSAKVRWLECEKQCVPRSTEVSLSLQIGTLAVPSVEAASFEGFLKALPQPQRFPITLTWTETAKPQARSIGMGFQATSGSGPWDFFPDLVDNLEFGSSTPGTAASDGRVVIDQPVESTDGRWPTQLTGLLVQMQSDGTPGNAFRIQGEFTSAIQQPSIPSAGSRIQLGFPMLMIFAFLGGLILNVMPCVLPVIALKILGFVRQGQESPARIRVLGLMYGAGVLASFASLAAIMIGLSLAGRSVHQGVLFQNSTFLVLMTILIVLISVNLLGAFEISVGGRAVDTTSALAQREGLSGAFFNGVLATILATPCSAPFLGVSIGYALKPGQNPAVTLLMYLMAGLGLAFPYIVLCFQPRWLKMLPKPGPWMNRFKTLMAFPMLGTAIWLFLLAAGHYQPDDALWLGLFLVVLALIAWLFGEFIQRNQKHRLLTWTIIGGLLVGSYLWLLESEVDWRNPPKLSPWNASGEISGDHRIPWQTWSPAAVRAALSEGRPVLVDFTAKWCATCQLNKRTAIEVDRVVEKIQSAGVVPLLGDFSFEDPDISEELRRFERAGVPLVLLYSINTNEPPRVLPEFLTEGMMLEALEWALTRRK